MHTHPAWLRSWFADRAVELRRQIRATRAKLEGLERELAEIDAAIDGKVVHGIAPEIPFVAAEPSEAAPRRDRAPAVIGEAEPKAAAQPRPQRHNRERNQAKGAPPAIRRAAPDYVNGVAPPAMPKRVERPKAVIPATMPELTDRERQNLALKRFHVQQRGKANPVSSAELSAIAAASNVPIKKLAPGAHAGFRPSWME